MSDQDEPGLDALERQLDQAFATTRPRRGFEDELWARLQARRPWWRRLGGALRAAPWGAIGSGAAAVLVVGFIALVVLRSAGGGAHGGAGSASFSGGLNTTQATETAPRAQSGATAAGRPGSASDQIAQQFGQLPVPAAAGVPQAVESGRPSPLPFGERLVSSASPPVPEPSIPVYRYSPAAGPPAGAILELGAIPAGLAAASYPSRQAADAFSEAATHEGSGLAADQAEVDLTQARLVYVAVVANGQGYLEPAYLYTGTRRAGTGATTPAQLLVPALAASALR